MPDAVPGWYVSVPMDDLNKLIEAARELPAIRQELARCYEQLDACRSIQIELMDKYQELSKML